MQVSLRCLMHAACRVWCVVCGVWCVVCCRFHWSFRFREAAGDDWTARDPHARGELATRCAPSASESAHESSGCTLLTLRYPAWHIACHAPAAWLGLATHAFASCRSLWSGARPSKRQACGRCRLRTSRLVRSLQRAVPSESYAGAYERPATRPRLHHVDLLPQHPPPARPSRLVRPRSGKCSGTLATPAPGLASLLRHLRREWAHAGHICTGTGPTRATSAPELITSAPGLGWPPEA